MSGLKKSADVNQLQDRRHQAGGEAGDQQRADDSAQHADPARLTRRLTLLHAANTLGLKRRGLHPFLIGERTRGRLCVYRRGHLRFWYQNALAGHDILRRRSRWRLGVAQAE
ncbi:MAG: hypothetical protein HND48_26190 [Chloroflexi bacterium]|nr:hypothetical protein [Chloroflexota bacterium]